MRFLVINTDYPEFLLWLYAQHPGMETLSYEEQMRVRVESLFGTADFYSSNLRKLGHEAWDLHANNELMQSAWAREHGVGIKEPTPLRDRARGTVRRARRVATRTPLRYLKPFLRPMLRAVDSPSKGPFWFYDVLAAQIKHYKPDVLLNQDMYGISSSRFLKEMKQCVRLLVGQIASPLPQNEDFACYDLIISSLPNFVEYFRKSGLPSELHRLAFDPRILERLNAEAKRISVSFVGSLSRQHKGRADLLSQLCEQFDLRIWAHGVESLTMGSPLRRHHVGTAWGLEMYQVLRDSKITWNHHSDVAGLYANNCRLYEATGVGTLLISDWKLNLHEMFEPSREVLTYGSAEECIELINYYLENDDEREVIARAGQRRTLRDHTYYRRMQELSEIVRKHL